MTPPPANYHTPVCNHIPTNPETQTRFLPSKVIHKDSAKKTAKKSRVKPFVKLVNYQHLMPTRYTLDVDLKDVVNIEAFATKDKKVTALKENKKRFEERFKIGKNRWFFTKLRF